MAGDTERLFVQLEARISDFEKKMQRAERRGTTTYNSLQRNSRRATTQMERDMLRSTTAINNRLATMQRGFVGLGRTLAGGLGIGLASLSMHELARSISDVVQQADAIGKAADRIGLTTGALQELRYAGDLAGVSTSTLEMSMQRFSRRIGEAASGTGELKDILEANDVAIRDNEGNVRPLMDLLADYADLIRNAGSDQERLTLAVKAFDSEGAAMINMLSDGSRALAAAREEANELGAVLEDDLVRSAEDVNDRFARLSATVSTRFKRAVLESIDFVDTLVQHGRDAVDTLNDLFEASQSPEDRLRMALSARQQGLSVRGDESFAGFFDRSSFTMPTAGTPDARQPTVIPGGTDEETEARTRNANAMIAQANATRMLIEQLEFENSLIGKSQDEIDILTAQRMAGANATDEQRQQIADLITLRNSEISSIERQTQAHKANEAAMGYLAESALDGLMSIASGAESAEEALKRMALQLAEAAAQAALFGSGPFAGVFGGQQGGGLLGSLFGGFRADGGPVSAGKTYMVGERGPELFKAPSSGSIVPNHALTNVATTRHAPASQTITIHQNLTVSGTIGAAEIARAIQQGNQSVLAQVPGLSIHSVQEHRRAGGMIG